ncbi:hypothetical protein EV586_102331 [Tumebacillus sp. BK434]|uniref:hypothetical protein n=1 Tax=Tumebacillus sp. BK434 TaxID=2512169 RepID=UPI00104EF7F3|nr:hypothetical protein [Tumebacillus sp. BK434]TCP57884.1 hypothetical protein EV586_102331 [Tumebacillus sp. BK434]
MKRLNRKVVSLLVLIIACIALLPVGVMATDNEVIVKNTPTSVPQEQTLQTLVVLNHDAKIEGRVTDVVFVYNGDVELTSTSKTGVVVVLGGHVQQQNGAYVEDGVAEVTFDNALLNNSLLALVVVAGLWVVRLTLSLIFVVLPVLLALALRDRLEKPVAFLRIAIARTGAVGMVVLVGGLGISLMLALSLLGAPIALLFIIVLLLLFAAGYTVVSFHVGKMIAGDRPFSNGVWRPTFLGAVAIVAMSNIPLFGGILLLLVISLSIGISTVWLWQWKARR